MMQQPVNQNDQVTAQQMQQQMVLCPVRVVYETQVLVQPGDHIQPNQTLFINPQNPPPWAQNRQVQNQLIYVQQMPGNMMQSIPQHMDQNQLYLHQYQNYPQGVQVIPQQMVQNIQERQIHMPNVIHQNMLQNYQTNIGQNVGQNVQIQERSIQQANYGQIHQNIGANIQMQAQQQYNLANNTIVSRASDMPTIQQAVQQNQYTQKVEMKPVYNMNISQVNQQANVGRPQPQILTVNPMQNMAQTTNMQAFAQNIVRPIKTESVASQVTPPTFVNASQNTQITRIRKMTPTNNVNKISGPNTGIRTVGQAYRPIQPRPQQFRPNLPNYSTTVFQTQANSMPVLNQNTNINPNTAVHNSITSVHNPNTSVHNPNTSVHNPNTAVHNSITSVHNPNTSVHNPNTSVHNPNTSVHNPNTSVHNPNTSVHNPNTSVHDPNTSVHNPNTSVHSPNTSVHNPNTSVHNPTTSIHNPNISVHNPNTSVHNPNTPVYYTNTNTTHFIKAEDSHNTRKRKSESPDEIHKKMAAIQVNITTPIKQVPNIAKHQSEIGINATPIHRNEMTVTPRMMPPSNVKITLLPQPNSGVQILESNDISKLIHNVQNSISINRNVTFEPNTNTTLEAQSISLIPKEPIQNNIDKDKLIRNTVYTQARGRVLTDKDAIMKETPTPEPAIIMKQIPEPAIVMKEVVMPPKDEKVTPQNDVKLETYIKTFTVPENIINENKKPVIKEEMKENLPKNAEVQTIKIKKEETKAEIKPEIKEEMKEKSDMNVSLNTMNNKGMFPVERSVKQERDYILTHVLDGIVIQESNVAFPIREPLTKRIVNLTNQVLIKQKEQIEEDKPLDKRRDLQKEGKTKESRRESHKKGKSIDKRKEIVNPEAKESSSISERLEESKEEKEEVAQGGNPFSKLNPATVKSWTTQELAAHLTKHDWGDTASLLIEHEIDGESLYLVSKSQLQHIGVKENHADIFCAFVKS